MVRDRCDCAAEKLQQWTDPHRVLAEISDVRIACGLVYQLRIITVFRMCAAPQTLVPLVWYFELLCAIAYATSKLYGIAIMFSKLRFTKISAIAVCASLLAPCAMAQQTGTSPMPSTMPHSTSKGMNGMDMKTMMKDMSGKMGSMAMSGNTDVDFAMMMRIHHQGAIDMAEAQLRDGKEPQMRNMAKDIIAAQKKEIAQFDKFLEKNGQKKEKMAK